MNDNRCFLYAMIADPGAGAIRYFKIGISNLVENRISEVQIGCPMPITEVLAVECRSRGVARACERGMHFQLETYRTSGEWFQFDMDNPEHKTAFHTAAKKVLDRELLPGWKWELTDLSSFRQYKAETRKLQAAVDPQRMAAHVYRLAKGLPMW